MKQLKVIISNSDESSVEDLKKHLHDAGFSAVSVAPDDSGGGRKQGRHASPEVPASCNGKYFRTLEENISEYLYSLHYKEEELVSSYHSPRCRAITGYRKEAFEGNPEFIRQITHERDKDAVTGLFGLRKKRAGTESLEHRIIRKDGAVRWVKHTCSVRSEKESGLIILDGFVRDITVNRDLSEQLDLFKKAFEQSPLTLMITDRDGNLEYVNKKFSQMTGYRTDEVIGKNTRMFKSGEQSKHFYKALWETILSGLEWSGEFHNKKKDGTDYYESASISAIMDSNEEITHFIAIKEDITRRREIEEALLISEERLRERNVIMEKDLKIAQYAQNALLPQVPPENDNFQIGFRHLPMEKVGGDFFSFIPVGKQGTGIFIGDVSGHGVSSALFLALVKSVTDRLALVCGEDPVAYLTSLNLELIDYMATYFLTGIYGFIKRDEATGAMTYSFANGAHPAPILISQNGKGTFLDSTKKGTVLGVFDNAQYSATTVTLKKGDRLFLYTDGIPETSNPEREILNYGDSLLELFSQTRGTRLEESLDTIVREIAAFRGTAPVEDDIICVGIEIR